MKLSPKKCLYASDKYSSELAKYMSNNLGLCAKEKPR